jgi:hypothetical protein
MALGITEQTEAGRQKIELELIFCHLNCKKYNMSGSLRELPAPDVSAAETLANLAAAPRTTPPNAGTYEKLWKHRFAMLQKYVETFKHLPPKRAVWQGYKIGCWATQQRQNYRLKKLSQCRIEALQSVQGWSWQIPLTTARPAKKHSWKTWLCVLREYVQKNKCMPEWNEEWRSTSTHVWKIGEWTILQRKKYWNNLLLQPQIEALEKVPGWEWGCDVKWEEWFAVLQEYVDTVGKLPGNSVVWRRPSDRTDWALGHWVTKQQRAYKNDMLSIDCMIALEGIKKWTWEQPQKSRISAQPWEKSLEMLREFVVMNLRQPSKHETMQRDNGEIWRLGIWCCNQRYYHRIKALKDYQIQELETVPGWVW